MESQSLQKSMKRLQKNFESENSAQKILKIEMKEIKYKNKKKSHLKILIENEFETKESVLGNSSEEKSRTSRVSFGDLDSTFEWYHSKLDYEEETRLIDENLEKTEEEKSIEYKCFKDIDNNEIKRVKRLDVATILLQEGNETQYQLIDARYPYEYNGGHIRGSINLWTLKDTIINIFLQHNLHNASKNKVSDVRSKTDLEDVVDKVLESTSLDIPLYSTTFIFYCEYSSVRAPNLANCIRNLDRLANFHRYPKLYVPFIWILDGGYHSFHMNYKSLCSPGGYIPMVVEIIINGNEYLNPEKDCDSSKNIEVSKKKDCATCDIENREENKAWSKIYFVKLQRTLN